MPIDRLAYPELIVNHRQAYFWLLLIAFMVSSPLMAGTFDLLLMPGQVISGHAKFEEKCESCHTTLKKDDQADRCLNCHDHENIAKDIEVDKGFHGRIDPKQRYDCRHCHTDHKGRDMDIIQFDPAAFDHNQTDFELAGAHTRTDCVLCHTEERKKYSQAPSVCFDCHKTDDPHRETLGKECDKCHNPEGWQKQKFDHDKDTEYKLIGRHQKVDCKLCHAGEVYKDTPKACVSCHLINDAHNGIHGDKCDKCHTSHEWKKLNFDHDKDTEFKLIGRHRDATCRACHTKGPFEKKPNKQCIDCHERDDEHRGRNGRECHECHNPKGWDKTDFDHKKDTDFPLKGRHAELVCTACHRSSNMDSIKGSQCIDCHHTNDVHKGGQGEQCGDCHAETGWGDKVFFDHDLTRFPLIGLHSITSCEACHLTAEYQNTERECIACHKSEDSHDGRFTEFCGNCHNPNGWMLWQFDHERQTEYSLEGAHAELHYHACHSTSLQRHLKLSKQCFACHRADDTHRGSFGRRCERCHTTDSFKDAVIR